MGQTRSMARSLDIDTAVAPQPVDRSSRGDSHGSHRVPAGTRWSHSVRGVGRARGRVGGVRGPTLQRQSGVPAGSCRYNVGRSMPDRCLPGAVEVTPMGVDARPRARRVGGSSAETGSCAGPKMSHPRSTLAPREPGWTTLGGPVEQPRRTVISASCPKRRARRGVESQLPWESARASERVCGQLGKAQFAPSIAILPCGPARHRARLLAQYRAGARPSAPVARRLGLGRPIPDSPVIFVRQFEWAGLSCCCRCAGLTRRGTVNR